MAKKAKSEGSNILAKVLSVESTDFEKQANSVEGFFKFYYESKAAGQAADTAITQLITLVEWIESERPPQVLESTQNDYPDKQVLLTKALVYLIENYGLTKDLLVNGHTLAILRDPRILKLAHQNNHQLIFEINRVINKRIEEEGIKKKKAAVRTFLSDQLKEPATLEPYTEAFSRFLYFVETPGEEAMMQKVLKDLIKATSSKPDMIVLIAYMAHGGSDWTLLNTIYQYYREENPLGVEDLIARLRLKKTHYESKNGDKKYKERCEAINRLINDLILVDEVHVFTRQKTNYQARWMAAGGFAFGMETLLGVLQFVALCTSLTAVNILAISFASCVLAGPFISMYFHSGHFNELKKMNQREYFEKVKNIPSTGGWSKGEIIGHIGTFEEGAAAGMLLMTLGGMILLDTLSRAILGGTYDSPMAVIPSYYFITEVLMACQPVWYLAAGLAMAAIVYSSVKTACAMKAAHYALDVPNSIEYYNEEEKDTQMRGVINKETQEPLFFTNSLKWRHKIGVAIDEFKEEYISSGRQRITDI